MTNTKKKLNKKGELQAFWDNHSYNEHDIETLRLENYFINFVKFPN